MRSFRPVNELLDSKGWNALQKSIPPRPAFLNCPLLSRNSDFRPVHVCRHVRQPIACSANVRGSDRASLELYISKNTSGSTRENERMQVLLDDCSLKVIDVWLLFAARVGDADTVQILLEQNADPNVADSEGSTPLMRAISRGHVEVARVLLSAPDIDLTRKNDWGYDAVIYLGSVRSSKPEAFQKITALFDEVGADSSRSELRWTQKPQKSK